jgi:hypothetical protein
MTVDEVADELDDNITHMRRVLNQLDEERDDVRTMPAAGLPGGGRSGKRYLAVIADEPEL